MGHGVLEKSFPWNEVLKTFKLGSFLISEGILKIKLVEIPEGWEVIFWFKNGNSGEEGGLARNALNGGGDFFWNYTLLVI